MFATRSIRFPRPGAAPAAELRRRTRVLGVFAGASAGLCGAVYAAAVRTRWGHRAGNAAISGRDARPPALTSASHRVLGTISRPSLTVAGGGICAVGLARGGWRLGLGAGIVLLGANLTTQVLKHSVLPRPIFRDEGDDLGVGNSLPSGHATVAMSLAVATVLVAPPRLRLVAAAGATGFGAAVGGATVIAGWHRPSDVIAADLVAVCWGSSVAAGLLLVRDRRTASLIYDRTRSAQTRPQLQWAALGATGLLASALAALLGGVVTRAWDDVRARHANPSFAAGTAAAACAAAATISALLAVLAGIDLGAIDDGPGGRG